MTGTWTDAVSGADFAVLYGLMCLVVTHPTRRINRGFAVRGKLLGLNQLVEFVHATQVKVTVPESTTARMMQILYFLHHRSLLKMMEDCALGPCLQ